MLRAASALLPWEGCASEGGCSPQLTAQLQPVVLLPLQAHGSVSTTALVEKEAAISELRETNEVGRGIAAMLLPFAASCSTGLHVPLHGRGMGAPAAAAPLPPHACHLSSTYTVAPTAALLALPPHCRFWRPRCASWSSL